MLLQIILKHNNRFGLNCAQTTNVVAFVHLAPEFVAPYYI